MVSASPSTYSNLLCIYIPAVIPEIFQSSYVGTKFVQRALDGQGRQNGSGTARGPPLFASCAECARPRGGTTRHLPRTHGHSIEHFCCRATCTWHDNTTKGCIVYAHAADKVDDPSHAASINGRLYTAKALHLRAAVPAEAPAAAMASACHPGARRTQSCGNAVARGR